MLPVSVLRYVEVSSENLCVFTDDRVELLSIPDIEFTFDAFAVCSLCRREAAIRIAHFANDKVENFFSDPAIEGLLSETPCVEVGTRKQGVIVKHLLEVRDKPAIVGGVSMESAADLI